MHGKTKKWTGFFLAFFMLLSITPKDIRVFAAEFAGGDGTEGNPYQVSTPEQLSNVHNHLDKHFIQTADIDMSASADSSWTPIGTQDQKFTGKYDGGGHSVIGLHCMYE